jgi:hypothetical protein
MNWIRTFLARILDPKGFNQRQIANNLSGLFFLFAIFLLLEIYILTLQGVKLLPVTAKIEELNKNINSLPDTNFKVKKIELKKEIIDLEIAEVNLTNKALESRFQLFGGIFIFMTLLLSWQSVIVSKEKQITEVLGKAIEQLGSESMEIRLGGIYTLERISRDSNKDFWTVIEILMAYIKRKNFSTDDDILEPDNDFPPPLQKALPSDVLAALKIISRRIVSQDPYNLVIDLSQCNFNKICLEKAHFDRLNLSGASFKESDLANGHFLYADLSNANLSNADLSNSNFRYANLSDSNFQNAKLEGADFKKAKFNKTNLEGADISKAILRGADLSSTIGLIQTQIDLALTDSKTILPNYLLAKEKQTNS